MSSELVGLTVLEVSAVDRPANSERGVDRATIALLKMREGEWDDADEVCKAMDGQTVSDKTYPAGDFAYVPDKDHPSTWKLRLTGEPGGKPDAGIVGAAVAALGAGFRGKKVQIPADALPSVKAKVRRAWHACHPDKEADELPTVLKQQEQSMTLEQIEKQLTEQGALITKQTGEIETVKSANAALAAENSLILKMGGKERKTYASMSEEKRKEYMAADESKRKSMLDAACKASSTDEGEDDEDKEAKKRADELQSIVAKAQTDAKELLEKAQADAKDLVAKADARLAEIEKRGRVQNFEKMAESELPNTPGTPAEKGARLMKLADAMGGESSEDFKKMLGDLQSVDKLMGSHFIELGKVGGGDLEVAKQIEVKAAEIAKRDSITPEQAYLKALQENPDMYEQFSREHTKAV